MNGFNWGNHTPLITMAFSRSKVLSHIQKYSTPMTNPVDMSSGNLLHDPARYRPQYSSAAALSGYQEEGRRFLNRIPRYRGIHPEIKDAIDAERTVFLFWLLGVGCFGSYIWGARIDNDRKFYYAIHTDKEFVGRYAYKEKAVEYQPRIQTRSHI